VKNRRTFTIAQIGADFADAPFGSKLKSIDYTPDGVPVIQGRNIKNNRFEWNNSLYVSEEKFESLRRSHCREGDLVFPKVGTIGIAAIMPKVEGRKVFLLSTNMMKMSVRGDIADLRYVYYYFCQQNVRDQIRSSAGGSSQPIFNFTSLKGFEISLPPIEEQRRIAVILSGYDDLIDNNTRRMKILEQMAQMLYQEWFVEFRFPDHERVRLVKSEMWDIPSGWKSRRVSEAVEIDPATKVPREGLKPFVPMGSLSANSMLITEIEYREGNAGSKFRNGDTLFARITPCLENGKTGFVQFLSAPDAVGFGSTEFIVLRSKSLCPEYVYLMARSDEFRDNAIKSMSGATGRQRVQPGCFEKFRIAQPPETVLQSFQCLVCPIFQMIHVLNVKNEILRQTRDLLLPKLITGEVSVERIEAEVPAKTV